MSRLRSLILVLTFSGICALGCTRDTGPVDAADGLPCRSDAACFDVARAEVRRDPGILTASARGHPRRFHLLQRIPAGPTSRVFLRAYSRDFLLEKFRSSDEVDRGVPRLLLRLSDGVIREVSAGFVENRMYVYLTVEVPWVAYPPDAEIE